MFETEKTAGDSEKTAELNIFGVAVGAFLREEFRRKRKTHEALKSLFHRLAEAYLNTDPEISDFSPAERAELKKELVQAFENAYILVHARKQGQKPVRRRTGLPVAKRSKLKM